MFGSEPWMIAIADHRRLTAGVNFVAHGGGTLILQQYEPILEWTAPISLGDDVCVGMGSIILPSVHIKIRYAIGASSMVTRDIPDSSVCEDMPKRFICTIVEYFEKLKNKSMGCGHRPVTEKAEAIFSIYNDQDCLKE